VGPRNLDLWDVIRKLWDVTGELGSGTLSYSYGNGICLPVSVVESSCELVHCAWYGGAAMDNW